jgi:type IV secretion system protein TrbL
MNFNDIYAAYFNAGRHYAILTQPYAIDLLGSLTLLEILTIALTYMIGDSDKPPAVLWSTVRLVFTSGFSYWWITQAWTLGLIIVESFYQLGQNLTGMGNLTPMLFLTTGLNIIKTILAAPASSRLIPDIGLALEEIGLCFGILVIFLFVAGLVILTLTAFYLLVGPGTILLPFLVSRWTSAMAEGYFTWLMRTGVMLLMFYVVLGTAQTFANQYNITLTNLCQPTLSILPFPALGITPLDVRSFTCSNPIPIEALLQILADMAILGVICLGVPFMAASLVGHGVNMTLEHLASAKYLASGIVRTLSTAVGGLAHQVHRLEQYLSHWTVPSSV